MIVRQMTRGPTSVILELRPYQADLQPRGITAAQIDALPPYMVIVTVGAGVVSRNGFDAFDDADGRGMGPSSYRGEAFSRFNETPARMAIAFQDEEPDVLVRHRRRPRRSELRIENGRGQVGEVLELRVLMDDAPNGVAGYNMTATLRNPLIGRITDVLFPAGFFIASHNPDPVNGPAVRFAAVDLGGSVQAGATDITLATIRFELRAEGRTNLVLVVGAIDDDNGDDIARTFINADIRVEG